jgi:dTDP-4-dehydrorhamnose 3,5-epimerase
MRIKNKIEDVIILDPKVFNDNRGAFCETYSVSKYRDFGIFDEFKQDNLSISSKNVLRGLHFQVDSPQAQLLTVISGCIYDVIVDLRLGSRTFGEWIGIHLSQDGERQVYMGPGLAHGFLVTSDKAYLHYKVTHEYNPKDEGGLIWSDKDISIEWPTETPTLSERDANFMTLRELREHKMLPRFFYKSNS